VLQQDPACQNPFLLFNTGVGNYLQANRGQAGTFYYTYYPLPANQQFCLTAGGAIAVSDYSLAMNTSPGGTVIYFGSTNDVGAVVPELTAKPVPNINPVSYYFVNYDGSYLAASADGTQVVLVRNKNSSNEYLTHWEVLDLNTKVRVNGNFS